MKRKVIKIDEDLCLGCGLCTMACKENVIELINGKARVMREDHCDGLGNCLPVCPANAITFEEREINKTEVKETMKDNEGCGCSSSEPKIINSGNSFEQNGQKINSSCGCPSAEPKTINEKRDKACAQNEDAGADSLCGCGSSGGKEADESKTCGSKSQLTNWPVQIKLANPSAPYFNNADLLIAADCCAYCYAGFHNDFIKGKVLLTGCPKLDNTDYSEKLFEIMNNNIIKSVTVAKMEVPCCEGIKTFVQAAINKTGKNIPLKIITISISGEVL